MVARSLNERLIMSMLLQCDGMTRNELVQASGLSAQTISVIVRALEAEKLIVKGNAVKGRVGPPSRPINLNPNGAFAIGLNVRSTEVTAIVVNLLGQEVAGLSQGLADTSSEALHEAIKQMIKTLEVDCGKRRWSRLIGVGLTLPRPNARMAISETELDAANLESFLTSLVGRDVHIQEEMTALVSAEAIFGAARKGTDYLQCFVDTDLHTRVCLDGRIYSGNVAKGKDNLVHNDGTNSEKWLDDTADALVERIESLAQFITTPIVVISSAYSSDTTRKLSYAVQKLVGPSKEILPSSFGSQALCIGAAALPFQVRFVAKVD
ncbi:ROK family protein [Actibacterium mucosum]|nr:winged helix-turn-helix transcriptional regulator [Actibacterium mucosum]